MRLTYILLLLLPLAACRSTYRNLKERAAANQDSTQWNRDLLARDIANFSKGFGVDLPLQKNAFPVADYDMYATSEELEIRIDGRRFEGISVGEVSGDGKTKTFRFTLFIESDTVSKKSDLVLSRNWPYFTAEGYYQIRSQRYNWVTAHSPDGYAFAFINMKLFDLRFGETIFIYPQPDRSFRYSQIDVSPNAYPDFKTFTQAVQALPFSRAKVK